MRKKTSSRSKNQKIERQFAKKVQRADRKKQRKTFNAPAHLAAKQTDSPEMDMPVDLFGSDIPAISVNLHEMATGVYANNLLNAGNLVALLDTAKNGLEKTKEFANSVYGENKAKDDFTLKVDTVIGQITDIRTSVTPFLRKYIGTQVKGVKKIGKAKTQYTETTHVLRTV